MDDDARRMAMALEAGISSIGTNPVPYPSDNDVALARKADASYGDPAAGYVNGPGAKIQAANIIHIPALFGTNPTFNEVLTNKMPRAGVDQPTSDALMKGYLASRHSAVAGLGFDPHQTVISPQSDKALNVAGMYQPAGDKLWFDKQAQPEAVVHESMHRGMNQLRQAGMMPEAANNIREESLVRALMMNKFGNLELPWSDKTDIQEGRPYVDSPVLKQLEDAAAQLYAKKQPRGPR